MGPEVRRGLLAALLLTVATAAAAACDPGVADLRDPDTQVRFTVEVADTPASTAKGLMFRESLGDFAGMLFVYPEPRPVGFWMENTLIPLDMLFFDASGRLTRIHANAKPLDRTTIRGGDAVQFVLEINAGKAAELGIDLGAELRHPAVDPAVAAWPCS